MRYVFKELRRHPARTAVSITGYAVAAIFILLILCVTGNNKKDSFGILQSTGTHFIVYIPTDADCCSGSNGNGTVYAEGVKTMLLDSNILRTIRNVEGVRDAAPCLLYRMYSNKFKADVSVSGIDTLSVATNSNVCARTNLVAGKFVSSRSNELVAEQSFATAHSLSVGDTMSVFGGKMVLAGIVNSGIKPVKADFYAPIGYVRSILRENLQCNAPYLDMNIVLVEVSDARLQDKVMTRIRNMMYKFAVSSYNCYEPADRVMSIIDRSSAVLTLLIFIFLVIFSGKTQLAALMERFREIGILKSLGWSDSDISINIFLVALIESIAGVTLGLLAGIILIQILESSKIQIFQYLAFRFKYSGILLIYCMSIAGALLASFLPVRKIYRTKAGEIIKNHM